MMSWGEYSDGRKLASASPEVPSRIGVWLGANGEIVLRPKRNGQSTVY